MTEELKDAWNYIETKKRIHLTLTIQNNNCNEHLMPLPVLITSKDLDLVNALASQHVFKLLLEVKDTARPLT